MTDIQTVYRILVQEPLRLLSLVDTWISKLQAHSTVKKYDAAIALQFRLAPDQFPLVRQIQAFTDTVKLAGPRLTGKEAPKFDDKETTWPEIQGRIEKTKTYLSSLKADDFKGFESRKIEFPWNEGKFLNGEDYIHQFVIPNFHFHFATAYSILRHNGVDVGKVDYLGEIHFQAK